MKMRTLPHLLFCPLAVLLTVLAVPVEAQSAVALQSPADKYLQALAITGAVERPYLNYRTQGLNEWQIAATAGHPWDENLVLLPRESVSVGNVTASLQPTTSEFSFNSGYPDGGNDGSAWQGRGFNGVAKLHGDVEIGDFRATVAPILWFAENRAFDLLPSAPSFDNEYAYFTNNIDLPQRFGSDPLVRAGIGESELRYATSLFTVALSNQSVWLGPAQHNPVLLSNNAGGVPRVEVGLRPQKTLVGEIEAYAWWGFLSQSEYFEIDSVADDRLFSGVSLSYAPSAIPGFTLGVHRVVMTGVEELNGRAIVEPFNPFMTPDLGQDAKDQRASITLDWVFPDVGFNVYAEWARNDYSARWSHVVRAPEHSQAFTYGVRQVAYSGPRQLWIVNGEISQFVHSRDYDIDLGKSQSGFYTHHIVKQGHTHNGQLLGAQAGPGADVQTLTIDHYSGLGRIGGFVERTNRNKDFIYGDSSSGPGDIERMNVQMRYGLQGDLWLPRSILLSGEFSLAKNWNRNYEVGNQQFNSYFRLGVTYGY